MTEAIRKKIEAGDGLTDNELTTAIAFYAAMEDGLRLLGPHFHFAWKECNQRLYELKGYDRHRKEM